MKRYWDKEYSQTQGIPSSTRQEPSSAAKYFYDFLKSKKISRGNLLDLGCGKGRNSVFFASHGFNVSAIDFSETAIAGLQEKLNSNLVLPLITPIQCNLSKPWLFCSNDSVDAALDIFVSKHMTSLENRNIYLEQLLNALKIDAYLVVHLAGINDGYYGNSDLCPIIQNSDFANNSGIKHIQDNNASGIESLLFNQEALIENLCSLKNMAGKYLELVSSETRKNTSPMYGIEYQRETHRFIFKCVN